MASRGLNKVMIIGNLGSDPEMRYTNDGAAIANFSIATTDSWKNKDGEQQEKTEWHRVVVFRRLAEICGEYLKKGRQVYIEGSLQTRSWEDKDGNKRYTTEIVARDMQMLGGRGDAPASTDGPPPHPGPGSGQSSGNADQDDDLPF